ncbi:MAG: hypothetical protein DME18_15010 [Verrucomicrobia bacterium]|nr:MAG: hypothetical protein DME18_15010 [Verrucomicrobiota bacterium]
MTTAEPTQLHRRSTDGRRVFPGACMENTNLRDLVLAAVRQTDPRQLIPVVAAGAGMAHQPPGFEACGHDGNAERNRNHASRQAGRRWNGHSAANRQNFVAR